MFKFAVSVLAFVVVPSLALIVHNAHSYFQDPKDPAFRSLVETAVIKYSRGQRELLAILPGASYWVLEGRNYRHYNVRVILDDDVRPCYLMFTVNTRSNVVDYPEMACHGNFLPNIKNIVPRISKRRTHRAGIPHGFPYGI